MRLGLTYALNDLYDVALKETSEGIRLFWQIKEDRKAQGGRKTCDKTPPHLQAAEQIRKKYLNYFKGVPVTVSNILSSWRNKVRES